jgi:adenylate kinase family enzyme
VLVDPPPHLRHHRRIVVHGVTGSGKSTLAARLSGLTGIPLVPVDDLLWRPGWVQLGPAEQVEAIRPVVERSEWVMDACWGATRAMVLARTDLVVALDLPRWVSLSRLVRRTAVRLVTREAVCGGNAESWRATFSRDSIVVWHARSFARKRAMTQQWATDAGPPAVVRFGTPAQVEAWLRALERAHT